MAPAKPSWDLETRLLSGETHRENLTIDELLEKYCGEFGKYQFRHFLLTSLAWALEAFHAMVMVFAEREPTGSAVDCGSEFGSWEWTGGRGQSTLTEWNLVCGDKYKVGLVQAFFFFGCMIGAGIFGHLSDTALGRRGSLIVVCILNFIFGSLTAFSPTYNIYVALRFLTGVSTGGVGLSAFVLATETVGATKRGVAGMSTFYFFSGGTALLSAIAYAFRSSWRHLYLVSSLPSLLFVILVLLPFVSESPRWYIIRGKRNHAMNTMQVIAKTNGRVIPNGVALALDDENKMTSSKTENDSRSIEGSIVDVIKSSITRKRLFFSVVINFLCSVIYYGLSLNVVNLKTNIYLNVTVNAVSEMPAYLLTAIMLDKFGRRPLTVGTLLFSGGFCLLGASLNDRWKTLKMVCGVLGIFGAAGTYNLLFIYTTELFPTVVRNAALGCATQAVQTGAILAPFVVVLGGSWPFVVFAVCGILGGVLGFGLPETLNRPLYDTMNGIEEGEAQENDVE